MKFCKFFFSLMAVFAFTACGDDNKTPDEPTPGPAEVKITSCSVAEGAEVDADEITEIRVTYNAPVTLNTADRITLNGSRLNASVDNGNTVVLPVNLTKGTQYQLVIPAHAVIANGGASYGPALPSTSTPLLRASTLPNPETSRHLPILRPLLRRKMCTISLSNSMAKK